MAKGFRLTIKSLHPEVTGSCLEFKVKRPGEPFERFIVDFGGFQEQVYENLNYSVNVKASELSYVLVTHSHLDHVERLPMLTQYGFHREIYCTPTCKKSIPICLRDSLKIMQSEYDKFGKKCYLRKKKLKKLKNC